MATEDEGLDPAVAAVHRVVAAFDLACSRFRPDSELEALNHAGGRPLRVSALLRAAVTAGLRAAQLTDGDVDPTLGGALIALGYDQDFEQGLDGRGAVSFVSLPGWRAVAVDDAAGTITAPAGVQLDLGATAKALAADQAAVAAAQAAGCGVLVNLGGDLALAGVPPVAGWPVRVTEDHRAPVDAPGQTITLTGGGLATSSTTVRRWRTDGETRHHLIDPATGSPAAGRWRTASVAAVSCLDANIAATAAIVRGERATQWLQDCGLPARLVSHDGRAHHVAGWPTVGDDRAREHSAEVVS